MPTPLDISTNLDLTPWFDLRENGELIKDPEGRAATIDRIGILPDATMEHRACVELLIRLPDGRLVIAETTLRLFRAAAVALLASPTARMEEE